MKFLSVLTLICLIDLMVIFSISLAQNWNQLLPTFGSQPKRSHQSCIFPLFNCRLINKFRSTKRQTGLRGISQTNPNMNLENGGYAHDQSSLYPSYALPVYSGSSQIPSYYQSPQFQNQMLNHQASNEYPMAMAMAQNAYTAQNTEFGPQATYKAQNYGQSPNTIDVHQVLDQFIRSAGLSPQGDHESEAAHSSSFAKAGTSPVLVFKKLLSFPFYVSTNPNVMDTYG